MFESSTRRLNREVRVTSLEQSKTATFQFEFAPDEPSIYQTFCDKIVKALEFNAYNATVSALVLNVSVPEVKEEGGAASTQGASSTFAVTGDAQLRTALLSTASTDTFCVSVSTRRKSTIFGAGASIMSKGIQVTCTHMIGDTEQKKNGEDQDEDDEPKGFRYRFFAGQENLLENFKEECMDALDLFGVESSDYCLHFKLDGEWVPITGDRAVLEVLSMLTAAGTPTLDVQLTQIPPKAPVTHLTLRCIFEGTLREAGETLAVSADEYERYLDTLTVECRALWDLTPNDEVTLFDGTVAPTEYASAALIGSRAKAELVIEACKATHEKTLLLRMERGNVLPELRSKTVSTHIHVLYLDSATNKFEQEAEFDFSWDGNPANRRGVFTVLADKIRALLHLTVPFDLYLGADAKGEIPPQSVKTDENVQDFLINAPEHTQLFCVKNSLHQEADDIKTFTSPLPVGRASYLRALIHDWRQMLPRQIKGKAPLRISVEEMKPIVGTWHLTWELKRREILFLQQFEDFAADPQNFYPTTTTSSSSSSTNNNNNSNNNNNEASLPLDELFSVLMRWTSYLVDEEVADFARHCQNMIDYVSEISNEARCNRISAKCFSALRSVGSVVNPNLLIRALVLSGTVGRPEAQACVDGYSQEGLEAWEFDEVVTYFFLDDASAFQKLLGSCATMRTTPDYSQHDTSMKSVREGRLRSELRHALDGVVPAHLSKFAQENWGLVATGSTITVPQNFLELAWCVSSLLNHPSSKNLSSNHDDNDDEADNNHDEDSVEHQKAAFQTKLNCWKWLIGECATDAAAADFLLVIRTTGMTYCSDATLQHVGVVVYNDGLDARLLHTIAGTFFSNLAQWCYVLQELGFLTRNLQLKTNKKEQQQQQQEEEAQEPQTNQSEQQNNREIVLLQSELREESPTTSDPPVIHNEISPTKKEVAPKPAERGGSESPYRVRYSPPRATLGLRPTPPATEKSASRSINAMNGSPAATAVVPRLSRIVSPRSTLKSAGYGLPTEAPTKDLNELLRLQKEESLLREFDPAAAAERQEQQDKKRSIDGTGNTNSNTNNAKVKNNADFALFTIKGAAGLIKHPMLHSVDSYVVAYDPAGAVVHQTPVIEGTCSPQYPQGSRFIVPLTDSGSVVFHVLTDSNISGFLGEATLKLNEAMVGGTREAVLKIKPRRGETDPLLIENYRDLGHLSVEVVPLKEPIFLPRSEPQGFVVWGKIRGADGLSAPEPGERRDFSVQVLDRAECPLRRTDAAARASDPRAPRWAGLSAEFVVPLELAIDSLHFKLIDEDLKGGRLFGGAVLPAGDLVKQTKEQRDQQLAAPADDAFATHRLPIKAEPAASPSSMQGKVSPDGTLTVVARVLGPLADDLAWRKRQEEAKRLAQARADELTEEKRKREAVAYERMLEDQEYIKAAEREADKQRASRAAAEKKKETDRIAKEEEAEKQARMAEAQQRAKKAALDAAEAEGQNEESQRRQAQRERAAAADAEEKKRMNAIVEAQELQRNEQELKERIRLQLEKEEADRAEHERKMEEEKKKNPNSRNNNNNLDASSHNSGEDPNEHSHKSQQEIAEGAAKEELKKAREEEARIAQLEDDRKKREFLEVREESPRREALDHEFAKLTQELEKQMNEQKEKIVAESKQVEEAVPAPAENQEKNKEEEIEELDDPQVEKAQQLHQTKQQPEQEKPSAETNSIPENKNEHNNNSAPAPAAPAKQEDDVVEVDAPREMKAPRQPTPPPKPVVTNGDDDDEL